MHGCFARNKEEIGMKIIIADPMEDDVVKDIAKLGDLAYLPKNLSEELSDADILIVRSKTIVTSELIKNANKLKIVARAGIGLDNIDADACEERGIKVINTPDASIQSVAELTLAMILILSRKIIMANNFAKKCVWDKKKLVGNEVNGKTLGIIGYGRIGRRVGELAKAMGMKVIAYDPYANKSEVEEIVGLDDLLAQSDYISLHTKLTKETEKMINKNLIAKMKDGVFFINTSRGAVVDEEALYDALKSGKIKGAALDVCCKEPYEGNLLELENVIFTSHIGANTIEAQTRIGQELIKKIKQGLGVIG
jgi:D-3-phosphoglycerate dehydrogenase